MTINHQIEFHDCDSPTRTTTTKKAEMTDRTGHGLFLTAPLLGSDRKPQKHTENSLIVFYSHEMY